MAIAITGAGLTGTLRLTWVRDATYSPTPASMSQPGPGPAADAPTTAWRSAPTSIR